MEDQKSSSNPTTVNEPAVVVGKVLSVLKNGGVALVEALIIADVPWLGWPGIKQIWEFIFSWIAGYFVKAAQNGATFVIIDIQVGAEVGKLAEALKAVIIAQKSGDPVAIKKAMKDYADAQSALVHDNGSSPAVG